MRKLLLAAAVATAAILAPAALADDPKFSVAKTTVGDLVKNEQSKAVLVKHIPTVVANPQLEQGYGMTFPDIIQYIPELSPELLKKIDEDLAKIK